MNIGQVKEVYSRLNTPLDKEYFYNRINSPEWLDPLEQLGAFAEPEDAQIQGDWVSYPIWHALTYLSRIARSQPDEVSRICNQIPETSNLRIFDQLVQITSLLPVEHSGLMINKLTNWLENNGRPLVFFNSVLLVAQFIEKDKLEEIEPFLLSLFRLRVGDAASWSVPTHTDEYWYTTGVEKILLLIDSENALFGFKMFVDLLDQGLSQTSEVLDNSSYMFLRSAIEDHPQNAIGDQTLGVLTKAVTNLALKTFSKSPEAFQEAFSVLKSKSHPYFHRIVLSLFSVSIDTDISSVKKEIFNVDNLSDIAFHNEYWTLVNTARKKWSFEENQEYLDFLMMSPSLSERPKEEEEKYIYSLLSNLQILEHDPISQLIQEFKRKGFETREHPEFLVYHGGVTQGSNSPVSDDQMALLTDDQLLVLLKTFKDSEDWSKPSKAGLAYALQRLIATNPLKLMNVIEDLIEVDEIYLVNIYIGWKKALEQNPLEDWTPITDLALKILNNGDHLELVSPDLKLQILHLLESGIQEFGEIIPIEFESKVWQISNLLKSDFNSYSERDVESLPDSIDDISFLNLNSVHSSAIRCLFRLAIRDNFLGGEKDRWSQLKSTLVFHLETGNDTTISTRAVIGSFLSQAIYMDREWVLNSDILLFPTLSEHRGLRDAVWLSYLYSIGPYDVNLEVLRAQYLRSLISLEIHPQSKFGVRLATHVVFYLLRGVIPDEDELVLKMNGINSQTLKRDVLVYISRGLEGVVDDPREVVGKSKIFIESRIARYEGQEVDAGEILEFEFLSKWLELGVFEDNWKIQLLERVAELPRVKLSQVDSIIEWLTSITETTSSKVTSLILTILNCSYDEWELGIASETILTYLESVSRETDSDTKEKSREIANFMGLRGHQEFRKFHKN